MSASRWIVSLKDHVLCMFKVKTYLYENKYFHWYNRLFYMLLNACNIDKNIIRYFKLKLCFF